MRPILRHPVTVFRQYDVVTVGDRIKERLKELKQDVKWLHCKTEIPVSSLYEIMSGRMKSTPRLLTIAAALGLRALWLEKKSGARLIKDADEARAPHPTRRSAAGVISRCIFRAFPISAVHRSNAVCRLSHERASPPK